MCGCGGPREDVERRRMSFLRFSSLLTSPPHQLYHTNTCAHTHRTLENQIQDLVTKITEGQGLPWPKPAHLKRLASYEKTRVMLLRQLEVKLKVRQPDEFVMATEPQIAHVVG